MAMWSAIQRCVRFSAPMWMPDAASRSTRMYLKLGISILGDVSAAPIAAAGILMVDSLFSG